MHHKPTSFMGLFEIRVKVVISQVRVLDSHL
jgi:hypothetical protein